MIYSTNIIEDVFRLYRNIKEKGRTCNILLDNPDNLAFLLLRLNGSINQEDIGFSDIWHIPPKTKIEILQGEHTFAYSKYIKDKQEKEFELMKMLATSVQKDLILYMSQNREDDMTYFSNYIYDNFGSTLNGLTPSGTIEDRRCKVKYTNLINGLYYYGFIETSSIVSLLNSGHIHNISKGNMDKIRSNPNLKPLEMKERSDNK